MLNSRIGDKKMRKKVGKIERTPESKKTNDKHLEEYEKISSVLCFVEREELFPHLVKLAKVCKKLQLPLPSEYNQYYFQTKSQLSAELKNLENKISISQMNNENYKHLEEKHMGISKKLGLTAI